MAVQRHWCFTLNNPTEADRGLLDQAWEQGKMEYLICGNEVGANGTPHVQGYMILKKQGRMSAVKKLVPRAHIEPAKGAPHQAADYCKKDGDFQERGQLPQLKHIKGGESVKRKWIETKELAKQG